VIRFSLLGSGSSGNALLITAGATKILVDSGLSFKRLAARVAAIGESLDGLRAVFVTHEHGDHILGLGTLARKLRVPVYATRGTYDKLPESVGKIPHVEFFEAGERIICGDLALESFSVSHDAADPVSYVVQAGSTRLGIACDMGQASTLVRTRLTGAHALILESNYCPDMLRRGPYPAQVQQRIRGRYGHLSNGDSNSLLHSLLHDGLQVVVLVHVSRENNCAELVERMARQVIGSHPVRLCVACQDRPTPLFELAQVGSGQLLQAGS
jgi:phosphoribosyl 1,2-cyclic phosphodiesterase